MNKLKHIQQDNKLLCGRPWPKDGNVWDEPDTDRHGNINDEENWCSNCLKAYEQL